uniref:Uncharacterized protein n=1 Tax=Pipistrellus kuhlii TaxID=59472 RepID=A0A7J7W371_PIPKU|nr:hypothetical protein mPipKuh1_008214 [Pipistrellus kuhlii]
MGWQLGTLLSFSIWREIQAPNCSELQFQARFWGPRLIWGEIGLFGSGPEREGSFLTEVFAGIIVPAQGLGTQRPRDLSEAEQTGSHCALLCPDDFLRPHPTPPKLLHMNGLSFCNLKTNKLQLGPRVPNFQKQA